MPFITYFHAEINELKFLGNANLPTAITFLFINEAFFEPNEIIGLGMTHTSTSVFFPNGQLYLLL